MHKKFFKFLFSWMALITLRYPYVCLGIAILSTIFSIFVIKDLSLDSSLTNLLPDEYESVRNAKNLIKETGGTDNFVIIINAEEFETLLSYASILKEELLKSPEIKSVYFSQENEFFYKNALLYTDLDEIKSLHDKLKRYISKEKVKKSPFFFKLKKQQTPSKNNELFDQLDEFLDEVTLTREKKYYYDEEKNNLALLVNPFGSANNISQTKNLYAIIQKSITQSIPKNEYKDIKVDIGGSYKNKIDEYETIISDIKSTAIIVSIFIFLILSIYFRSIYSIFFITLPLIMSITWTFAIAQMVIGKLNTFTGFLFVILFGLGVDFGIHLYSRYAETRKRLFTIAASIKTMFLSTGKASMTSAFTTAVVFYSLTLTNFKGFSEFGFIAGTGIIMAMLSYFIVLPSLLILAEKLSLVDYQKFKHFEYDHRFLRKLPLTKKSSAISFTVIMFITLISILGLFKIEFDYDFTDLRANLPSSSIVKENIGRIFKDSFSPAVFISETLEEVDKIKTYFENKMEGENPSPNIDKIRTIRDIVPKNQDDKRLLLSKINKTLTQRVIPAIKKEKTSEGKEKLEKINKFMGYLNIKKDIKISDVPLFYKNKFLNYNSTKYLSYVMPLLPLRDGKNAIAFATDVEQIEINDESYSGGGSFIVFAEMLQIMIKNGKLAIILSFISVFLVLFFDFRSFRKVLIVTTPLLAGLIWLCLIMYIFNLKLNFFNIIVIPSIIGIGIDNGVHLYHRFLEEKGKNLRAIFLTTGSAVFMTSFTTAVGFSGLAMATHGGLNSIGTFAVIGIATCFFSTILIMPNLFNIIRRKK